MGERNSRLIEIKKCDNQQIYHHMGAYLHISQHFPLARNLTGDGMVWYCY